MFTILLHSSKTMRQIPDSEQAYQKPILLSKSQELATYLQTLTQNDIQTSMKLSEKKAFATYDLIHDWNTEKTRQLPAIDAFLGDIYSGLQVQTLSDDDRKAANDSLYILSGLYGVVRALDSIYPYRLEMGYKFPDSPYDNLYSFWGSRIAEQLPKDRTIINLSAVEYTKAVFPHLDASLKIISPRFLSVNPKTHKPTFVVVHAKIARGAFAHWLITSKIQSEDELRSFTALGYHYSEELSTPNEPVFVCQTFGGLGLSVRLT